MTLILECSLEVNAGPRGPATGRTAARPHPRHGPASYPRGVTRTPRRRLGCLIGSTLAVLVVVGGALLADRVTHGIAEDAAADAVRSRLSASDLDVRIDGFPFLTQVVGGTLDDVHLAASSAVLQGLEVTDLDVAATGVTIRGERGAEHVVATATVPTAVLQAQLRERTGWDLELSVDGDQLVAGGTAAGLPASASLAVAPAGAAGLTATITSASLAGLSIDASVLPDGLASRLTEIGVVEQLPAGASITGATVEADGLHLVLELDDVTLDEL